MTWPFHRRRPFELRIDGHVTTFRAYDEAYATIAPQLEQDPWPFERWDIAERIGGRLFNRAFGFRAGTTSTTDLASMGVPINPASLNDRKL